MEVRKGGKEPGSRGGIKEMEGGGKEGEEGRKGRRGRVDREN